MGIGSEWPHLSRDLGFFETLSPAEYRDVQSQAVTLDHIVMWDMGFRAVATGAERPEMLLSAFWFDAVFPTLGLQPALGRGFSPGELERADPVAILSYRIWQTRLAGDPSALGRIIQVDGAPHTVIGVMPRRGQIIGSDLWIPMGSHPDAFPRQAPADGNAGADQGALHARGGQRRAANDLGSHRAGVRERIHGIHRVAHAGTTVDRGECPPGPSRSHGAARSRSHRPPHRLRQRRQPAAGKIGFPPTRARGS